MLSPTPLTALTNPVDNSVENPVHDLSTAANIAQLGWVLPKRHAKRAVTRNLLRRQMRSVVGEWVAQEVAISPTADSAQAVCVVRLRQPWDRAQFPSAASTALKQAVRQELQALVRGCRLQRFPVTPR
jgi:ribonuclease P protein component